jgi:hypothetical protein
MREGQPLLPLPLQSRRRGGGGRPGPGAGREGRPPWAHENEGGQEYANCVYYLFLGWPKFPSDTLADAARTSAATRRGTQSRPTGSGWRSTSAICSSSSRSISSASPKLRAPDCSSQAHEAKAERRSANPKRLPPNHVCLTCERDLKELVKGNVYDSLAYTLILAYDCVIN